ncbi:MAG: holo-[acyl-carrier-protein] synthase [Blastochloris viridis]|uniref:Holo-[acyl-carrier-protein] synthase n=1 Tax=Blastochloris viridis TaxID=1079 RepID=A0A6N4R998_BLAVI|nr:MAG: holo-[acyl-carrier-protein] synthase [Blastochloris viridis]
MSIYGIGTDICAIARIEEAVARFGDGFYERILTEKERSREWTVPKLARRWAIKESVSKALGCGIGAKVGFQDIDVYHDENGKPHCVVRGFEHLIIHVSASDDTAYASAFAVAETRDA